MESFEAYDWFFLDAVSRGSEEDLRRLQSSLRSIESDDFGRFQDIMSRLELIDKALLMVSRDALVENLRETDKPARRMLNMLATAGVNEPVSEESLAERLMIAPAEVEATGRILKKHCLVGRHWRASDGKDVRWSIDKDGAAFLEELASS